MITTTTYRLLGAPTAISSTIFSALQNYTGAYLSYGLDTPISVQDVLINCDIRTALYCLNYCTTNTTTLQLQLGLTLAASWQEIIAAYQPIEDRFYRLLYFANAYLQAQGETPTPPRYDYAGHIIPGVSAITANQVNDYITLMQEVVDSYSTTKANPGMQFVVSGNEEIPTYPSGRYGAFGNINGTPAQNAAGTYIFSPICDQNGNPVQTFQDIYFNAISPNIDGYIPELITKAVLDGSYAAQSDQMSTTDGPYFYLVPLTPSGAVYGTDSTVYPAIQDNGGLAMQMLGQAAIAASQAVLNLAPCCSIIYNCIVNAVKNYGYDQRMQLNDQLYALVQIANGVIPPAPIGDLIGEDLILAVIQAGNDYRNAKLADPTFWAEFDTNYSLKLEMNERYNAEVALRAGVVAARKATAAAYVTESNTLFGAYSSLVDGLSPLVGSFLT
jgi:hypothetical protein